MGKTLKAIYKWVLGSFIFFSTVHADTTHNAGEIESNVNIFGASTSIIWPHQTNPSAPDQLFSMSALLGFGGSVTRTYTTDTSTAATFEEPASNATEETTVYNLANISGSSFSVQTMVRTFDDSYGLLENVIEYDYRITNNTSQSIDAFYAGDYFDFDLGTTITNDRFGYDASRSMYYQYLNDGGTYVGVRVVSGTAHSAHFREFGDSFNYSYASIADGVQDTNIESTNNLDVTMTLSQEFTNFDAGSTVKFVIAVIFGEDLASIQAASDASFSRNSGTANVEVGGFGSQIEVSSNAPSFHGYSNGSGGGCLLKKSIKIKNRSKVSTNELDKECRKNIPFLTRESHF